MVGELYDYMIGIVVVGIIFVSAVFAIPAISYVNLLQVNQQQLRNTALNVFNAMLLGTGSPSNWGSIFPFDQNNVEAFGLDLSKESSLYVLDTDKLQRLDKESPGYIEYPYVRDLLGLEEYGFSLSIFRPFTVDWDLRICDPTNVCFNVNVTRSEDRRPIPNAQVSVTILCAAKNPDKVDEPLINVTRPNTLFTDALGRCGGVQPIKIPSGYILETAIAIMRITVAGISTMVVAQRDQTVQNVMKINTFGDTVVLTFRGELTNTSAVRRVLDIMSFNYDETLTEIYEGSGDPNSGKITEGYGYVFWNRTFPGLTAMDPALLLFLVSVPLGAGGGGRRPVIVVGPFSLWESSKIFSFGSDSEQVRDVEVKLRRYVVLSGITYIAELSLWKEKA